MSRAYEGMNPESGIEKLRTRSSPGRIRHFSMIRGFQLADVFTLGNAACGVAAVFFSMLYIESRSVTHFFSSAGMMIGASYLMCSMGASHDGGTSILRWGGNSIRW